MPSMAKPQKLSTRKIRDASGKTVIVQGFGALKESKFKLRPGIDLSKPIAAQIAQGPKKG